MPRKASVKLNNYSKDECARRSNTKVGRGDSENKSYERERLKKRPSQRRRSSRDDFSDTFERYGHRKSIQTRRIRPQRPTRERSLRNDYKFREQHSSTKSPGILIFSFFSNLVFYGVTIGIIFMAVMFSFSSKSTASIFGYRFYTVLTNSMVPQENGPKGGFYAGDVVIVKLMDGDKVKPDDIVTFAVGDGSRYLTHRMVERKEELNGEKGNYLVTKGDANKSNDPPITSDRVLGKVVFAVPKIGNVIEFAREEFWACLVCILSLYGFFLVLKSYLFTPEKDLNEKKKGRRPMYERQY